MLNARENRAKKRCLSGSAISERKNALALARHRKNESDLLDTRNHFMAQVLAQASHHVLCRRSITVACVGMSSLLWQRHLQNAINRLGTMIFAIIASSQECRIRAASRLFAEVARLAERIAARVVGALAVADAIAPCAPASP